MAAKLQCEICGGRLIGKPGGIFECDSCGMEYDATWVKEKIQQIQGTVKVEGTVEVTGKVQVEGTAGVASYLRRAELALEQQKWDDAVSMVDKALDITPENGRAYILLDLAEKKCTNFDELAQYYFFRSLKADADSINLRNADRFGDETVKKQLDELYAAIERAGETLHAKRLTEQGKNREDPRKQALKKELEELRKKSDIIEEHIITDMNHTIVLNSDGKVSCTPIYDDEYNIFNNGKNQCAGWSDICSVYAKVSNVFGVTAEEGTLVSTRTRENKIEFVPWSTMQKWHNLIKIDEFGLTCGITDEGTVLSAYDEIPTERYHGQDKTETLNNVAKLVTNVGGRLIALRKDGTLAATEYIGDEDQSWWEEISQWKDLCDAVWIKNRIVGIKKDGTLVGSQFLLGEKEETGWPEASTWTDIVQLFTVASGRYIGLTAYGKPMITRRFDDNETYDSCFDIITRWSDIVKLYKQGGVIFGLTKNGKVLHTDYAGEEEYAYPMAYDTDYWNNVAALSVGFQHTVGVLRDGAYCSTFKEDDDDHGETFVWHLDKMFHSFETVEQEFTSFTEHARNRRKEREEKAKREAQAARQREEERRKKEEEQRKAEIERKRKELPIQIAELQNRKIAATKELENLKGLFTGKRRKELEAQIAEDGREIERLQNELNQLL